MPDGHGARLPLVGTPDGPAAAPTLPPGSGTVFADPLRRFLDAVLQASGAEAASLFVAGGDPPAEPPLLVHAGQGRPIPEHATVARATAFAVSSEAAREPDEAVRTMEAEGGAGVLLRLRPLTAEPGANGGRRRSDLPAGHKDPAEDYLWLGLRRRPPATGGPHPAAAGLCLGEGAREDGGWAWGLVTSAALAWHCHRLGRLVHDATSGLPGRLELQRYLGAALNESRRSQQPLGVLLVNPDDFALVNHRVGRAGGDEVLREVGRRTQAALRKEDVVFRYGGAVLAAVLPGAGEEELPRVAEKLRSSLTQARYRGGEVRLAFSVGGAPAAEADLASGELNPGVLLHRSDLALDAARLSGGGRAFIWAPGGECEASGNLDRLSAVFTADTEKDYRNMMLLWETVTVISSNAEPRALAGALVERLCRTLRLARSALFAQGDADEPVALAVADARRLQRTASDPAPSFQLSASQCALVEQARARRSTERHVSAAPGGGDEGTGAETYVVPLFARERYLGFVLLQSAPDAGSLDSSDLLFLEALARQLAVALDRAQLAEDRQRQQDLERQQLRAEVRGLRDALPQAGFIYHSAVMHELVGLIEQVAPTEATVLVCGESGTGKEVVARTLHELSHRKQAPFVTVDCGAIAHGLLEAELFGRAKGAYTGADSKAPGRIALADGGTLFLDEIGELPLEVQAKLLRVVQEREITPVGSTETRAVNVRIVAATNRDLELEVARGCFRADLYYRLQVVTLRVPPLRDRPDDILPLAQFFLRKFALQYQKGRLELGAGAQDALRAYHWPGNVRELQNRVLQAVVLCVGAVIEAPQVVALGAAPGPDRGLARQQPAAAGLGAAPGPLHAEGRPEAARPKAGASGSAADPWQELRVALAARLDDALAGGQGGAVPIGRWLNEDLVRAADSLSGGVGTSASARLGMAESTFRRQRDKLRAEADAGLLARRPDWSALEALLRRLVATDKAPGGTPVTRRARDLLLSEVMARVGGDAALGARLMGVTLPTYRRWADQSPAAATGQRTEIGSGATSTD